MTIYFTADTHFGHAAAIEYHGRPFSCVQEMDEHLIERWNSVVHHGDTVYHLGDFSFHGSVRSECILANLRGVKHIVVGNHDRRVVKRLGGWEWVHKRLDIEIGDHAVVLRHYPPASRRRGHALRWHLHGHCHGRRKWRPWQLDVGVDIETDSHVRFTPWSWDEVVATMVKSDAQCGDLGRELSGGLQLVA